MLQVSARSYGSQTWVRNATIVFRTAGNGISVSQIGDCNILTL